MSKDREEVRSSDAAKELGVVTDRVRRYFNQGFLEGHEAGRVLWIYRDSLESFKQNPPVRRGKPVGRLSDENPKNRATRWTHHRVGRTPKKPEEIIAAGEKERERQREWQRNYRARVAAKGKAKKKTG